MSFLRNFPIVSVSGFDFVDELVAGFSDELEDKKFLNLSERVDIGPNEVEKDERADV